MPVSHDKYRCAVEGKHGERAATTGCRTRKGASEQESQLEHGAGPLLHFFAGLSLAKTRSTADRPTRCLIGAAEDGPSWTSPGAGTAAVSAEILARARIALPISSGC